MFMRVDNESKAIQDLDRYCVGSEVVRCEFLPDWAYGVGEKELIEKSSIRFGRTWYDIEVDIMEMIQWQD